jgi:hypothetical protein
VEDAEEIWDMMITAKGDPNVLSQVYGNGLNSLTSHMICALKFNENRTS